MQKLVRLRIKTNNRDWNHMEKISRRCCWWSIDCVYKQSNFWWKFFRKSANVLCVMVDYSTRWLLDWEIGRFTSGLHKTHMYEKNLHSFFNEQGQFVKIKPSTQQADKRTWTASAFKYFARIAILFSRLRVVFINFVPVIKGFHLSLKRTSNLQVIRDKSMVWDQTVYKKRVTVI